MKPIKPSFSVENVGNTVTVRYYGNERPQPAYRAEVSVSLPLDGGEHKQEILEFRFTDGERWNGTFAELQHALKVAKGMKDFEESTPWAGSVEGLLTDERRKDMLIGALEGGSNYWYAFRKEACQIVEQFHQDNSSFVYDLWRALKAGYNIPVHDIEDDDDKVILGSINMQSIMEGEALMKVRHPEHWADIINEDDDATTADVWFQMVVLKVLVYG